MVWFSQETLQKYVLEAVRQGRLDELRVLLGPKPVIRQHTYALQSKLFHLGDDIALWEGTIMAIQKTLKALKEGITLEGTYRETTLQLLRSSLANSIVLKPPVHVKAGNQANEKLEYVMLSTEGRISLTSAVSQAASRELRIDWSVSPEAIIHIHASYRTRKLWEQEQLLDQALPAGGGSVESIDLATL